jgi:hypothetical protein
LSQHNNGRRLQKTLQDFAGPNHGRGFDHLTVLAHPPTGVAELLAPEVANGQDAKIVCG